QRLQPVRGVAVLELDGGSVRWRTRAARVPVDRTGRRVRCVGGSHVDLTAGGTHRRGAAAGRVGMLLAIALGLMLYLSATNTGTRGESAPIGGSMLAGLRATFADPFLRLMALLMLCSDGVGTLAYALVADYAKAHFADAAARTAFYGHID